MKITIFGAAGRTGSAVVAQALVSGHEITAFVRDPSKLLINHAHLSIIKGDATDLDAVKNAIADADAVVSVMAGRGKNGKTKPLAHAIQNIIDAMREYQVKRLIITSSSVIPCQGDKMNIRFSLLRMVVKTLMPASYHDSLSSLEKVRSSDTDWTIVRMGRASYSSPTGVKTGYIHEETGVRITRDDAAAFILSELSERMFIQQAPVIWSR